jgi:Intracellular proteinase inhibitor
MDGRLAASMWVDSKEVVNHGPRPVTLQFRDSQRYGFLIRNVQGQEVWRWSADQLFTQMLSARKFSHLTAGNSRIAW